METASRFSNETAHPFFWTSVTARARNRRIEILLTPALDPAPSSIALAKAEPAKRGEALARAKPVAGKSAKKH